VVTGSRDIGGMILRVRGVILMILLLPFAAACNPDYGVACLQPDPPALLFYVRSARTGVRLDSLTGTVTSKGEVNALRCLTVGGLEECNGWAHGSTAIAHIERAGYLPWDSGSIAIARTSGACSSVILKKVTVDLSPQ
jgi:hypothetical protein